MKQVKFFNTGRWAEHKPYLPQFEVKAGQILTVPDDISMEIADIAVEAKKAEYVSEGKSDHHKNECHKPKKLTNEEALEVAKGMGRKSKKHK